MNIVVRGCVVFTTDLTQAGTIFLEDFMLTEQILKM